MLDVFDMISAVAAAFRKPQEAGASAPLGQVLQLFKEALPKPATQKGPKPKASGSSRPKKSDCKDTDTNIGKGTRAYTTQPLAHLWAFPRKKNPLFPDYDPYAPPAPRPETTTVVSDTKANTQIGINNGLNAKVAGQPAIIQAFTPAPILPPKAISAPPPASAPVHSSAP